jgi:hypothetical protein
LEAGKLFWPPEEGVSVSRGMFRHHNARENRNTKMANKYHTHVATVTNQNGIHEEITQQIRGMMGTLSSEAAAFPSAVYKRKDSNTQNSSFSPCFEWV